MSLSYIDLEKDLFLILTQDHFKPVNYYRFSHEDFCFEFYASVYSPEHVEQHIQDFLNCKNVKHVDDVIFDHNYADTVARR